MALRLFAVFILMVSVVPACSRPAARGEKKAHQDSTLVAHETRRTWESLRPYTFSEKAVFLEKAGAALERVERGVADFQAAASDAFAADPDWGRVTEDLRVQGQAVRRSLAEVEASTSETWEDAKSRFFVAITDLRKAVEGAVSKLDR